MLAPSYKKTGAYVKEMEPTIVPEYSSKHVEETGRYHQLANCSVMRLPGLLKHQYLPEKHRNPTNHARAILYLREERTCTTPPIA